MWLFSLFKKKKVDTTVFPITQLPVEVLLLMRPHLSIATLCHLSRTCSLLRAVFWEEKALQIACFARGVSRPLEQVPLESMGTEGCDWLYPDYRMLCANLVQHGEGCKVKACKAVIYRQKGGHAFLRT